MQYTIKHSEKSTVQFEIKADAAYVAPFFEQATRKIAESVKVDGFRPGKAPAHIVKDMVGESALMNEAQELAFQASYTEMVKKEDIIPTHQPVEVKVDHFSEEEGMSWSATVDVVPTFSAKNWKELVSGMKPPVDIETMVAGEDEVEETLKQLQGQLARSEPKDGVAEKGDFIRLDLDAKKGSDAAVTDDMLAKIKSEGIALVIGEGRFIPGFEDQLIGVKAGETKEFELTFPENYATTELAGRTVIFVCEIKLIEKIVLPELNDEFAKQYGQESYDQMKKVLMDNVTAHKKQEARSAFEQQVMIDLTKKISFEVPVSLIEQETDMMITRFAQDLEERQGIGFEKYLEIMKKSVAEIRAGFAEQAETNVRIGLVLGQITKDEGVEASEQDVLQTMTSDLLHAEAHAGEHHHGHSHDPEEIKKQYADPQFVDSLKNSLRVRKVIDMIIGATSK